MARVLIVGGGCRGRRLAGELGARRNAVRITSRDREGAREIERAGAEAVLADPDVVGSLRYALDGVTVVAWLLGTATGSLPAVRALHAERLEMMLRTTIDTTVRGFVYEAAGTAAPELLGAGAERVRRAGQASAMGVAILTADPGAGRAWQSAALAAIDGLLAGPGPATPGKLCSP